MTIEGDYSLFAHLETVYLGCLARRTLIMRNVREVVEAAHGKPILFFPARHDHWLVQTGDGWAAHVAGAIGVSTDAQASWWGGAGVGTVPHGLIAAFGGDTVRGRAGLRRPLRRRDERDRAGRLRERLGRARRSRWPTRSATGCGACGSTPPSALVDRALWDEMGDFKPTGVNPELVARGARGARRGGPPARADRRLGRLRRRADPRLRGGSACRSTPTASARRWCAARTTSPRTWSGSDGRHCAKVGRRFNPNPRLEPVASGLNQMAGWPIGLGDEASVPPLRARGAAVRAVRGRSPRAARPCADAA